MRFLKEFPGIILAPVILLGAVALSLYLLGMLQDYLHPPEHGPREYASIEEAEAVLGFPVTVPTYFPSYISWPPAEIRGQLLPVPRVETVYHSQYGTKIMVITQIASVQEAAPDELPWGSTIREKAPITVGDHAGVMLAIRDADGRPLNGAYWQSGNFSYVLVTSRSERELLTIVRSM